jgi:hypothetical protein
MPRRPPTQPLLAPREILVYVVAVIRIALSLCLACGAFAPSAFAQDDAAGPKPPFEGDGGIGTITVTGGGGIGDTATGSFSPYDGKISSWRWTTTSGNPIQGCADSTTSCTIRINGSNVYQYDPASGRWDASKTGDGWAPLGVQSKDPQGSPAFNKFTRDYFKVLRTEAAPECGEGGIDPPGPRDLAGGSKWTMHAEVSEDDGLVLTDVKLGERYLAAKISLPHFSYAVGTGGTRTVGRGELMPKATGRSALVEYEVIEGPERVALTAKYEISGLPGDACLNVSQDYVFTASVKGDHCEPAGKLPCARFVPAASYSFKQPPAGGEYEVSLPQRFDLVDDIERFNAAALMLDQDTPGPSDIATALRHGIGTLSAPVILDQDNPVTAERTAEVITGGSTSASPADVWDNYHQSYLQQVSAPRVLAPDNVLAGKPFSTWAMVPGCPECIHMHWRWGAPTAIAPGFEDANEAKPRIPAGSTQDVTIGIVRGGRTSEEDPLAWRTLADGESMDVSSTAGRELPRRSQNARVVLWYEGTGHQQGDSFMTHGAFFGVDRAGKPKVREAKLKPRQFPAGKGIGATLRYRLSEWGGVLGTIERKARGRSILVDEFEEDGGSDRLTVPISGRVDGKRLPVGTYTITLRARDLSGDLSKRKKIEFKIVKKGS